MGEEHLTGLPVNSECTSDHLNETLIDDIRAWINHPDKGYNMRALTYCTSDDAHTDLVTSPCFCPVGELFKKVRNTLRNNIQLNWYLGPRRL